MRRQIKGLFNEPAVPVKSEPCADMCKVSKSTSDCDIGGRRMSLSCHVSVGSKGHMVFLGRAQFNAMFVFGGVLCRHSPWNA